jgi:hypothetical protein
LEKYDGYQVVICFLLAFFFLDASSVQADNVAQCENDSQVCTQLLKIQVPQFSQPDECYEQAKNFLKSEYAAKRSRTEGSYREFMLLTEGMENFKQCREFLQRLADKTKTCELQDAKLIFSDNEKESLDQSYYSYQTCQDLEKSKVQSKTSGSPLKKDIPSGDEKQTTR